MSGLILLGIAVIWVAVLVPMWCNRHDASSESRSVNSFSTAMRVLSRRPAGQPSGSSRSAAFSSSESWGLTVDNHPDAVRTSFVARLLPHRVVPRRAAGVLARRRRTVLALLVLALVAVALAVTGLAAWWVQWVFDVLVVGYLVHVRRAAARERELRRRRQARLARSLAMSAAGSPRSAVARTARAAEVGASADVGSAVPQTSTSASGTDNGSRWEPVPVPLPTYVSKPVATRPAARIPQVTEVSGTVDLTRPGAWTREQLARELELDGSGSATISASAGAARARAAAEVRAVAEAADDELDLILGRRRVVGG